MEETFPIMLAEDDSNDVFLFKRALKAAGVRNPLSVVRDGQEAIDYLQGVGPFSDRTQHPIPGLLFLDIKMPRKNGLEVLQWIRESAELKSLPVVIASSSQLQGDVERGRSLGVNAYLVKPVKADELRQLFEDMPAYFASRSHHVV